MATSARPDAVEGLFPRTVAVGRRFGVIVVVDGDVHTEVATFRTDGEYRDGRRPESVRFTGVDEDARRRDFTINGLFEDPTTGRLRDVVGGRDDLDARLVRAIGDPDARFAEDRLRMLRAIRFAAVLDFTVEGRTWEALCRGAEHVSVVSKERIAAELVRILTSGRSERGLDLLERSGLLDVIAPELTAMRGVEQPPEFHPEGDVWRHTLLLMRTIDALPERPLSLAFAALLHDVGKPPTYREADRIRFDGHAAVGARMTQELLERLRQPRALIEEVTELVAQHMTFIDIRKRREAKLRRFLTGELAEKHLALHRADCLAAYRDLDTWQWCRERRETFLAEPPLPPRLLSGHDLIAAGYHPGPGIGAVLAAVEDRRLERGLTTREQALAWALEHMPPTSVGTPAGGGSSTPDAGKPEEREEGA